MKGILKNAFYYGLLLTGAAAILVFAVILFPEVTMRPVQKAWDLLKEPDKVRSYVSSFGSFSFLVFMLIQILQVVFAPVPGEATGLVGGYIFGAWKSFILSSIALTIGSGINFYLGRFFGNRLVRKKIPDKHLERFDSYVKKEGFFIIFFMFVFPGFPKDYLSLFLGISRLPAKAFFLLAGIGRMPGTLMLSIQGAMLFEKNLLAAGIIAAASGIGLIFAYRKKEKIYEWLENRETGNIPG